MPTRVLGVASRTKKGWIKQVSYVVRKWYHQLIQHNETPYRIAMGCACGIFSSTLPVFGQTFIAILFARLCGASVLASVPWSWISNPLTTLPIWYAGYKLGLWLLPTQENTLSYAEIKTYLQNFETIKGSQELVAISSGIWDVLKPLWLGTVLMGIALAFLGFAVIYWMLIVKQRRRLYRRHSGQPMKTFKPLHNDFKGKSMTEKKSSSTQSSTFENSIAGLSILGICSYLVFHTLLDRGHQEYTLSLNFAFSSSLAHLFDGYQQLSLEVAQLPLLAVLVVGGIPLVFKLCVKLFKGEFGADLLAGISIITAVLLDEYLAGSLVVLMLSGGVSLENYAVRKASSVLEALAKRMPSVAHRKIDATLNDISTDQVKIGDTLLILPHEICPVDGTVLDGEGCMDESYLTGEPYMMSKTTGSPVMSGAINGDAALTIRADKLATDSRYSKIMEVMRSSEQYRPNIRRLGDQLGALYTPLAVLIACAAWVVSGDEMRFLAVLVVATPCPLLIGIPVTIISSISLAARLGIIIKNPAILETIGACRTAIFDKTGTLTYGRPTLTALIPDSHYKEQEVLTLIASLERYSKHPLSSAIVKKAEKSNIVLLTVANITELPGQGLKGDVAGKQVQLTSRKKFIEQQPNKMDLLPPTTGGLECVVLINNTYAATLQFRDEVRSDSSSFIHHLRPKHLFEKVLLVSGDRESEVRYLAEQVGIKHVYFSQSPEQKLDIVRNETQTAKTLFLGDGINDAPSLTAATIGIAFGQNSDITGEAADAVIMDSSLLKVDELLHIGERMRSIALQSAVGGMLLSVVAMAFAGLGYLTPVAGAITQEIIDVFAVLNALRAAFQPRSISDYALK
ncbi:heavy metal translocating P-type ATPase [Methylomonas sp. AM2-LC]|uniref:heavy metal translocating P-type ATPase n=1 Tax=Methylomonas sp. AM2-LC TaxID=3153301 RepID=UPI0032631744